MAQFATIGVYGFDGAGFIRALREAGVGIVLDVRQRRGVRGSEYAWANSKRLQGALSEAGIGYTHLPELARRRVRRGDLEPPAGGAGRGGDRLPPPAGAGAGDGEAPAPVPRGRAGGGGKPVATRAGAKIRPPLHRGGARPGRLRADRQ